MKEKVIYKNKYTMISAILLAFLTTISLFSPTTVPQWEEVVAVAGGENRIATTLAKLLMLSSDTYLSGTIVLGALIIFYFYMLRKQNGKFFDRKIFFLSFFFSIITLIGRSFEVYASLAFILENRFQSIYCIFLLLGYLPLYYMLIYEIFILFDFLPSFNKLQGKKIVYLIVDKKPFLVSFVLCFIMMIPIWIAEFPGTIGWDIMTQFDYYYGIYPLNDHHPIFSTFFMAFFFILGVFLVMII